MNRIGHEVSWHCSGGVGWKMLGGFAVLGDLDHVGPAEVGGEDR